MAGFLIMVSPLTPEPASGQVFERGDIFLAVGGTPPFTPAIVDWYRADGTFIRTIWGGLAAGYTTGMDFDADSNLYVTDFTISQVSQFDNDGTFIGFSVQGIPHRNASGLIPWGGLMWGM